MAAYEVVFASHEEEQAYPIEDVEGSIPADLRGTLLRNGPGIQRVGGDSLCLFDGHGMVAAVTFDRGEARFRCRHVNTEVLRSDRAAGRQSKRMIFTNKPSRWANFLNLGFGNSAAHDVYAWGGRIFAANDLGHYALDLQHLETVGNQDFGGRVHGLVKASPMPRFDQAKGRLVAYTLTPGVLGPDTVEFHEFDEKWNRVAGGSAKLDVKSAIIHDLAFTERWYVVVRPPLFLDLPGVLKGDRPPIHCIDCKPEKPPLAVLASRTGGASITVGLKGAGVTVFHILNAYDEDDTTVVLDVVGYGGLVDFRAAYPRALAERMGIHASETPVPHPVRCRIDTRKGTAEVRMLSDVVGEAPDVPDSLHGRKYTKAYLASGGGERGDEPDGGAYYWFHAVCKVDMETGACERWSAGTGAYCSPPAFVARADAKAEDDGWLLTWVLDPLSQRTDVAILDARDLAAGPVARLRLHSALPFVSHTRFVEDLVG